MDHAHTTGGDCDDPSTVTVAVQVTTVAAAEHEHAADHAVTVVACGTQAATAAAAALSSCATPQQSVAVSAGPQAGPTVIVAARSPGISPQLARCGAQSIASHRRSSPRSLSPAAGRGCQWSPLSASGSVTEGDSFLLPVQAALVAPASMTSPHADRHDHHDDTLSAFQARGCVHLQASESLPSSSATSVASDRDGRSASRASVCTDVSDAASETPLHRA